MPAIGFICPNRKTVTFDQCLKQPCHMGERCLTKNTLTALLPHKEWNGKPSTTQLLNPTLIAYLEITRPYHIDPQDMVFAFIGTKAHKKLELAQTDISKLETFFEGEDMTGIADCYEDEDGLAILADHKFWGSYRIQRALKGEVEKESLQLNRYRLFFEAVNLRVDKMIIQAFPRDGGLQIAKIRGIHRQVHRIPIPKMPDEEVLDYFARKRSDLKFALEHPDTYPPECSIEDTWNRKRCAKYCNVQKVCPYVGSNRIKK